MIKAHIAAPAPAAAAIFVILRIILSAFCFLLTGTPGGSLRDASAFSRRVFSGNVLNFGSTKKKCLSKIFAARIFYFKHLSVYAFYHNFSSGNLCIYYCFKERFLCGKGGEKIGEIFVNMGFYTNLKSTKLYREYYFLMSKSVQNYVQNVKKSPKNR